MSMSHAQVDVELNKEERANQKKDSANAKYMGRMSRKIHADHLFWVDRRELR